MSDNIPDQENDGGSVAVTLQLVAIAALVIAAVIIVARFELFCLRDLAHTPNVDLQYLTRQGWIALIAVAIPLGAIAYVYTGKIR